MHFVESFFFFLISQMDVEWKAISNLYPEYEEHPKGVICL